MTVTVRKAEQARKKRAKAGAVPGAIDERQAQSLLYKPRLVLVSSYKQYLDKGKIAFPLSSCAELGLFFPLCILQARSFYFIK